MLSQRIAKQAIIASFSVSNRSGDNAVKAFEEGLAYLHSIPLSTPEIRAHLVEADAAWSTLRALIEGPDLAAARAEIALLSETMLASFDQLTDLYERSMQTLME